MLVYSRSFTWHSLVYIVITRHDTHLALQLVCSYPCPYLHQEDDAQQDGEGEGHAVVLLNSPTTTKESNEEDDAANNDEKHRSGEESITKKVKILTVSALNYTTSNNQKQS